MTKLRADGIQRYRYIGLEQSTLSNLELMIDDASMKHKFWAFQQGQGENYLKSLNGSVHNYF